MSTVVDLERHRWKRHEEVLLEKLTAFGRRICTDASLNHALEQYWGRRGLASQEFDDEASFVRFFDWFLFDYRRSGRSRRVVERFRAACWDDLAPQERSLLAAWERSRLGVYEVVALRPGEGVTLLDVFTGERLDVAEKGISRSLHKYDLLFTRPLQVFGTHSLSVAGLVIPRSWKRMLESLLRHELHRYRHRHPDAGWEEFFRRRAHRVNRLLVDLFLDRPRPRFKTTGGEDLLLCRAWFDVLDRAALTGALAAASSLRPLGAGPDGTAAAWAWCGVAGTPEEGIVLGEVRLIGSRLRLQCLSRGRLRAGKRFLAGLLGGLVRHRIDDLRRPEAFRQARLLGGDAEPLPPDAASVVRQFLQSYYRRWVDEPVPALGGRSPRQACASPEGRLQVVELLKFLENMEEKKKRAGQPFVEVNLIRRELGLPEEE